MAYINLKDIAVDFPVYQGAARSLRKAILSSSSYGNLTRGKNSRLFVRALEDITIDFRDGDRVGLVGGNGAGKSTLLKVLAGIYEPTRGSIVASGRISALLDIAVGLDEDATGRENIELRGVYMDIRPREIRSYIDEIAEFTELGDYLDMPIRTYSSGMMVRLAFAISTCIPPQILLLDEWLSAGDANFIVKAQARMAEFVRDSSLLVLASHSEELLKKWCTRGIFLDHGRVVASGTIDEALEAYRISREDKK